MSITITLPESCKALVTAYSDSAEQYAVWHKSEYDSARNVLRIMDVIDASVSDNPMTVEEAEAFTIALQLPRSTISGNRLSPQD